MSVMSLKTLQAVPLSTIFGIVVILAYFCVAVLPRFWLRSERARSSAPGTTLVR